MSAEEQKIQMQDNAQGDGGQQAPSSSAENPLGLAEPEKPPRSGGRLNIPRPPQLTANLLSTDAMLGKYGNSIGDKIESGLSPLGKPLGKGLGIVGKPVGGLVEPLVGGLLKSGDAYGQAAGVGAGNLDHKNAAEEEERRRPVGGQEQTADNPLGL